MKKDRLRAAINRSGIKQTRIAELLEVNVNTVSRWLSGDFNPTDDKKLKLAEILGTTVAYLMGETDNPAISEGLLFMGEPPLKPSEESELLKRNMQNGIVLGIKPVKEQLLDINQNNKNKSRVSQDNPPIKLNFFGSSGQTIKVPIFERAYSACCGSGFPNADQIYSCAEDFIDMPTNFIGQISPDPDKRPFMIYAEGDSMIHAGITDGSQLLINPAEEVYDGESALIEYGHNKSIAVKRIYWLNGSGIEIRSANGDGWKRTFTLDDQKEGLLRIIGKVVWYGNKPKRG